MIQVNAGNVDGRALALMEAAHPWSRGFCRSELGFGVGWLRSLFRCVRDGSGEAVLAPAGVEQFLSQCWILLLLGVF